MVVKASKVEQNPTLPFSDDEIQRIVEAARSGPSSSRIWGSISRSHVESATERP
jgi:nitroreductase